MTLISSSGCCPHPLHPQIALEELVRSTGFIAGNDGCTASWLVSCHIIILQLYHAHQFTVISLAAVKLLTLSSDGHSPSFSNKVRLLLSLLITLLTGLVSRRNRSFMLSVYPPFCLPFLPCSHFVLRVSNYLPMPPLLSFPFLYLLLSSILHMKRSCLLSVSSLDTCSI